MDKQPAAREQLLTAALETARALGLTAEVLQTEPALGREHADALVRIGRGDGETALYAAEVRRGVRPATLGATLVQLERLGPQALLVTDYVTPPLAEALKERRVAFLDAAGNAYIQHAGLFVWVNGHKPAAKPVATEVGRAFQPTGLQVLFTLLCNPAAIKRPYRELAAMAGVAHGTVGWVIPDLQRQGYVADLRGRRGTRRLFQLDRLLGQWADAYARQLRPRTLIGRYYIPKIEGWRDWPLAQYDALWGGEPAGALLTNYLRPGELTIYAQKLPALLAAQQKFLKDPAPGHTAVLEVRRRFWHFPADPEHPGITPAVLVYADLLATGDARCIETAKMVYDAHVARLLDEG